MLTLHQYKIKSELDKSNEHLSIQFYNLFDLLQNKVAAPSKKVYKRLHLIKRTSPFLLVALLLPVAFIFLLLMQVTIDKWLLSFLFTCLEINILFTDFALWNFYEGKKILRIWVIEAFLILIGAYFIKNKLF